MGFLGLLDEIQIQVGSLLNMQVFRPREYLVNERILAVWGPEICIL